MDFDKRNVRFEEIHNIKKEEFDLYLRLAKIQNNSSFLDLGSGYGAVTREILKRYNNSNFKFSLIDNSPFQIRKAKKELKPLINGENDVKYMCEDACIVHFDNAFDVIFSKMFLHELNIECQIEILKKTYDWLKPDGRIVIWEITPSLLEQNSFNDVIKYKDKISNFTELTKNRHFSTNEEILFALNDAKFSSIEHHHFNFMLNTENLLGDFNNNIKTLNQWNNYIIEDSKNLNFIYINNNVKLYLNQSFYVATK